MRVVSVNVGEPIEVRDRGRSVATAIFKRPASGRVAVVGDHLEGDRQADLSCHGGKYKAVYAYPLEHYAAWQAELNGASLEMGQFGENLTVEGLLEADVHLGDRLRIGSALLQVAQPRMPCFKLGIRMGDPTFPKRFMQSGRTGFYLSIVEPGDLAAGDAITRQESGDMIASIATVWRMCLTRTGDPALARQLSQVESLGIEWREPLLQIS